MQYVRVVFCLALSVCLSIDLCARGRKGSDSTMTDMSIEGEVERIVRELESYGPGIDHAAVTDKLKRLHAILPEVAEAARRAQFIERLKHLGFNFVGDAFNAPLAAADDDNEKIITLLGNATALLDTLEDTIRNEGYDQSYGDQLVTELYVVLQQIPVSQERDRLLVRAEKTGLPLPEIYLERFSDVATVPLSSEQEKPLRSAQKQVELQRQSLQSIQQAELYKRRAELAEREAHLIAEKLELCQQLLQQEEQKNAIWKESRAKKEDTLSNEVEPEISASDDTKELAIEPEPVHEEHELDGSQNSDLEGMEDE